MALPWLSVDNVLLLCFLLPGSVSQVPQLGQRLEDMCLVKGTVRELCESYGLLRQSFHFPMGIMVVLGV